MTTRPRPRSRFLPLALLLALGSAPAQQAGLETADPLQHIHFHETDAIFANPGIGWMVDPYEKPRFPGSIVYLRLDWNVLEPAEGQFHWKAIDDVIARAQRSHATIAMRIMTANAHSKGYYSSPKWLFDLGCKGFEYKPDGADAAQGTPQPRIEPDYADPIYLREHAAFLQAFGARYNGSPALEFLDIGSYGIWGEWHTPHPAPIKVRKKIVDMYLQAFPNTQLVYMSDDADVMAYALAHGAGLRRDGVGDPWHEARWAGTPAYAKVRAMGDTWKHAPIVFEWFLDYSYMQARGWSFDSAVNFMLRNHVSVIHDNLGAVPPEAHPLLNKLARLAGYRFVLRELDLPAVMHPGDSIPLTMDWANAGVAPIYRRCSLTLELRNTTGDAVLTSAVAADPRDWLPGEHSVAAMLTLPAGLPPGDYTLHAALIDAAGQRPPLKLAIDAEEQAGWYTLATLAIAAR
jgi:hypothetical protein